MKCNAFIFFPNIIVFFFFQISNLTPASGQIFFQQFSTGYTAPVDIKTAGDDRLFVVEQGGYIRIMDTAGNRYSRPFLDIHLQVVFAGERGLLGMAFDPEYKTNGYFYIDYISSPTGETHISRFHVSADPDSADASSEEVLLSIYQPYTNHKGGGMHFSPRDHYLYVSTGDGGSGGDPGNRAQNLDSLLGKILRIDVSHGSGYSTPADNPFVGKSGRAEIWAYGLRNAWRWSFDRLTHDMWIGDVGQNLYEEIDFQKASSHGGENYGWRCYEANHLYDTTSCGPATDYVFPLIEIPHSAGAIAAVGGYVYRGAEYANMFGKYLYTDEYTSSYGFHWLLQNGGSVRDTSLGTLSIHQIVSFGEDSWGELYAAEYNSGTAGAGIIYKIKGDTCSPVAFISDNDTLFVCDTVSPYIIHTPEGKGFHYQWYKNGLALTGNDNDTLMVNNAGGYQVMVTNRNGCTAMSNPVHLIYSGSPAVSITGLDTFYCRSHAPVTITGNPSSGGIFSGIGISNSTFNPAVADTGYHLVTYAYEDSISQCSSSASVMVHVGACVGYDEVGADRRLFLFPDPNSGNFTFVFYLPQAQRLITQVLDVTGRLVYNDASYYFEGKHSAQMSLPTLSKGIYVLRLLENDEIINARFIIVKS